MSYAAGNDRSANFCRQWTVITFVLSKHCNEMTQTTTGAPDRITESNTATA